MDVESSITQGVQGIFTPFDVDSGTDAEWHPGHPKT